MRVNAGAKKTVIPPTGEKVTVHNVFILDRSGSMGGPKYTNAENGMNIELEQLKKNEDVNFTQTIIEFDYSDQDVTHCFLIPIKEVKNFIGKGAHGATALYECVGNTIQKLLANIKKGEKVLLKIFTDGGENDSSRAWTSVRLKNLIDTVQRENGFTVTFEGTKHDTDSIIQKLGIDKSNTNVHNNTAESIFQNALTRSAMTASYSKSVAAGEDVTVGFYSKSIN